jgi:hypothetical protein
VDYGRFAEASYFMARFDEARTGTDSPEQARDEDAQCFYREYARMLMSHDLCRATDWDRVFAILPGAKDPELEEEAAREKKRDAEERIRLLKSTKGTFAFDYMPQYAVEELTQLVDDVVRLVGSTLYQKGRVLELGDGALLGERLKT